MNSTSLTTGAIGLSGAMLGDVVIWLCNIAHVPAPPDTTAAAIGAVVLCGAHALSNLLAARNATAPAATPIQTPNNGASV